MSDFLNWLHSRMHALPPPSVSLCLRPTDKRRALSNYDFEFLRANESLGLRLI
jgi:hypothetical protein